MLNANDHVLDWVDDYLHELLEPADSVRVERHCEQCRICQVGLEEAQKRFQAMQHVPASEASEDLIQATLYRVAAAAERQRAWRRMLLRVALPAAAAVVLLLTGLHFYFDRLETSPYDLRVLGQKELLAGAHGSLRVQLVNRATGEPMPDVPIELHVESRQSHQIARLAGFTTNRAGTGQVRFDVPDWASGDAELRVAAVGRGVREFLLEKVRLKRSWKVMLSSDKPVYQPGQSIQVRALALRQQTLKPVAAEPVAFSITDPKGNVIFRRQGETSKFGIAACDCPLATEVIEGPYTVACKVGDTESRRTVQVQKYVLPKFKVDVTFDRPYYRPGQTVTAQIRAIYFFGKPVEGGEVDVAVQANGVRTLNARTDADGKASVSFPVPAQVGREQLSGDARLPLNVTVTDAAGQVQTRSAVRNVTQSALRIEVIPEGGQLVRGVTNKVYVFASYPDGRPVRQARIEFAAPEPQKLTADDLGVAVAEVTPEEENVACRVRVRDGDGIAEQRSLTLACGAAVHDFVVRTDKAVYRGGDSMTVVTLGGGSGTVYLDLIKDGQTVLTDTLEMKDGKGEYQLDLPAELFGTVELYAYRLGADVALPVRKSRVLFIRPAAQVSIQTTFDKDEYRPGSSAKLQFTLTDGQGKPAPGALSLAAVDEAVFSVLDAAPGMEKTFYLLEEELLRPIYTVYAWSPDEAQADYGRLEQAAFARTSRTEAVRDNAFFGTWVGTRPSPAQPQSIMNRSSVPPPGQARGATRYSLSLSSFMQNAPLVAAERERGLHWVHTIATILVVATLLGSVLGIIVVIVRNLAERLADGVPSPTAILFMVCMVIILGLVSITALGRNASATFSTVSQQVGAMPGNAYRGPAPKSAAVPPAPGPAGVEMAAPVRVRESFPETLLWKPELITDDQGRATLDLELADSITTWRLSASAVTADGRLGAAQAGLKVFQPFFVDLNLPATLTRGDEVSVPVVVYNYLAKPQAVEVKLDAAPWFELQGEPIRQVELAANEVRSLSYRLTVKKVGNHQLQATARGQGVADALRRGIEVVPDGKKVEQVVSDRLSGNVTHTFNIPEDAVEDSAKLLVKICPGAFSQVLEGLDGMLRMPHGCMEQTSSSAYPNLLIVDYLKKTRQGSPQLLARAEQFLHVGYQRLLTFENRGGGFDWWGTGPPVIWLSAYGLAEFSDMARVMDVDRGVIARTQDWLLRQRDRDGAWAQVGGTHGESIERMGDARLLLTSYVVWSLLQSGYADPQLQRSIDFIRGRVADSRDNAYALALAANALAAWDPKDGSTLEVLKRLDALRQENRDAKTCSFPVPARQTLTYARGDSVTVETTALAVLAMMKVGGYTATVNEALTYLVKAKGSNGTWGSTSATILSLKALLAGLGAPQPGAGGTFTILVNGREAANGKIDDQNADVLQLFDLKGNTRVGPNELTIRTSGGVEMMYQVIARHYDAWPQAAPAEPELDLKVTYDRAELTTADKLHAVATLRSRGGQTLDMVMLELGIPPGFTPDPAEFDKLVQRKRIARYSLTARQITLYLERVQARETVTVAYTLQPKYPLKVKTPASTAYEYYTPSNRAEVKPVELSVREP